MNLVATDDRFGHAQRSPWPTCAQAHAGGVVVVTGVNDAVGSAEKDLGVRNDDRHSRLLAGLVRGCIEVAELASDEAGKWSEPELT